MHTLNPTLSTVMTKKDAGAQSRYHHRQTKLAIVMNSALICFWVATITITGAAFAQSNMVTDTAVHAYKIPPGPLKVALVRFAKKERIKLHFEDAAVAGKTTKGLKGNYTMLDGLNQLLGGNKLQAVLNGDIYVVQELRAPNSSNDVRENLTVTPKSGDDVKENLTVTPKLDNDVKERVTGTPKSGNDVKESVLVTPKLDNDVKERVTGTPKSGNDIKGSEATLPVILVSAKNSGGYTIAKTTTATKTNTLLRDVPQSVSVVTRELIKDQSMQSMADVVRYVPGMGVSQGEGNRDALVFRGNRSTGDFFSDGLRDDVQYYRDLYNVETVEVLKGPNGMIFGRGGAGGVVNRVIKEADWNPIREVSVQGGSYNNKRVALDVGQGINDVVAVRLNTMYENSDSYRDGVNLKRFGFNPTVTIKPTDNTKVVLKAEYFKDERTADRGVPSFQGRPLATDVSTFFGDPNRSKSDTELKAFNALIEHKFDNGVTIRNRTRVATQDKFYENVYAGAGGVHTAGTLVAIDAYNDTFRRDNLFNQTDLLFSLNTGGVKHELVAGVEIGRQETNNMRNKQGAGTNLFVVNVPITNPITNIPINFNNKIIDNHSVTNVTSLYLQDQIQLLPKLQAIIGLRYDRFDVDFSKNNAPTATLNTTDNLFSPRVGLVYKPIEVVSIYTNYSLSYVPRAGEQLVGLTVTNQVLAPEKFQNIEVGAKWDINPNLAFTTAAFQLDRSNVIIQDPNNPAVSFLGGGQQTKGLELGLTGRITSAWSVMGAYTYQDGKITNQQSLLAKIGATLAELPTNTFSLWNRYDFTPAWGAGLGVINRSAMYTSTDNTVSIPGFTRVDVAVYGKIDKNLRVQLNIENLFNTNYYASAHNNNNITPGSPIVARVSLVANF